MSLLRTLPTGRLLALLAAVVVIAAGGTAIALGAVGGGGPSRPPSRSPRPSTTRSRRPPSRDHRADHVHEPPDRLRRACEGGDPLLTGATGRLWLGDGGTLRLELQSDSGDAQIVSDGKTLLGLRRRLATPSTGASCRRSSGGDASADDRAAADARRDPEATSPSSRKTRRPVAARRRATSPASRPTRCASRRSTTAACSAPPSSPGTPRKGVPLRAAVYAQGSSTPVLELKATDISYGTVPASDFDVTPPAGREGRQPRRAERRARRREARRRAGRSPASGRSSKALPFKLSAPADARRPAAPRGPPRRLEGREAGALVTYGQGLGGIAVIEQPAEPARAAPAPGAATTAACSSRRSRSTARPAQELDTALGTVIRFQRGGVAYTVARLGAAGRGRGRGARALSDADAPRRGPRPGQALRRDRRRRPRRPHGRGRRRLRLPRPQRRRQDDLAADDARA